MRGAEDASAPPRGKRKERRPVKELSFSEHARRFFNGIGFPLSIFAGVTLGHAIPILDLPVILMLFLMTAYAILFCDNIKVLIPMALMMYYIVNVEHGPNMPAYSDYYTEPLSLLVMSFSFVVLFGSLFIYLYRHRRDGRRFSKTGRLMLLSLLIWSIGLLLNGVFAPLYTLKDTVFALALAASFLMFIVLLLRYVKYEEGFREYLMQSMVLTELTLIMQILLIYATGLKIEGGHILKDSIVTGWGTWASIGCMLAMMLPACFYLAARGKYCIPNFCIGIVGYLAAMLTMSRNAWLVASGVLAVSFYLFFLFAKKRKKALLMIAVTVGLGLTLIVLLREQIFDLFFDSIKLGIDSNGRTDIWSESFKIFKRSVLFGTGFYDGYNPTEGFYFNVFPYLLHNTWLQMLVSCGIFGLLTYVLHRATTVYAALRRLTPFRVFIALSVVSLLLSSMIDVHLFQMYPGFVYSILLAFFVYDSDHARDEELIRIRDLFLFWKRPEAPVRAIDDEA